MEMSKNALQIRHSTLFMKHRRRSHCVFRHGSSFKWSNKNEMKTNVRMKYSAKRKRKKKNEQVHGIRAVCTVYSAYGIRRARAYYFIVFRFWYNSMQVKQATHPSILLLVAHMLHGRGSGRTVQRAQQMNISYEQRKAKRRILETIRHAIHCVSALLHFATAKHESGHFVVFHFHHTFFANLCVYVCVSPKSEQQPWGVSNSMARWRVYVRYGYTL